MQDLTTFLDGYSQDLTTLAQDGRLDPVIGRSDEIGELIEVLCQGTAVLLVGRAGVDKTTIVEGLAERIIMHNVPNPLLTKHVRQTDMGILIHRSYKPGFNELSTRLTEAFRLSESIMYIEIFKFFQNQEVVKIFEALLKAAIYEHKFPLVCSISSAEYMEWVEHDPALFKLFQLIQVDEPSVDEALSILRQIREAYEQHYKLEIADEALQAAVHLSAKFLPDLALPNKAIDLIDEAAAQVRLNAANKRYLENQAKLDNAELEQTTGSHHDSAVGFKIDPHAEIKGLSVTAHDIAEVVAKWIGKSLADIFYE